MKIEVNKIMNPAFLLGTAFNIAYWHRKYHSGTICKGVSNPQTSNALSGCEKEETAVPCACPLSNHLRDYHNHRSYPQMLIEEHHWDPIIFGPTSVFSASAFSSHGNYMDMENGS